MSRTATACSALLAVMLFSPVTADADPMVKKINEVRRAHGVPPLRHAPRLSRSSHSYARHLMRINRFAHNAMRAGASRYRARGEILALQRGWRIRRRAAVRAWLHSPSHRYVLLSRRFRYAGAGMSRGRLGSGRKSLWVVRFGRG